jgi:hypothetical protein
VLDSLILQFNYGYSVDFKIKISYIRSYNLKVYKTNGKMIVWHQNFDVNMKL